MTTPERRAKICAVDNHPVVLRGIVGQLTDAGADFIWVGSATTWAGLTQLLDTEPETPDIALVDLDLGDGSTPSQVIGDLTARGIRCVILTAEFRPIPIRAAIAAGAVGLALKDDEPATMIELLQQLTQGAPFVASSDVAYALASDPTLCARLAPREVEVLRLLADGLSYSEVARQLDDISIETVKTHVKRIFGHYRELNRPVNSALDAVQQARRDGYLGN